MGDMFESLAYNSVLSRYRAMGITFCTMLWPWPSRRPSIAGAAYAPNPECPYTPDQTPLFCDLSAGGAISPDGFGDPTSGRQYVVYKVDGILSDIVELVLNTVAPIAPTPLNLQQVSTEDEYNTDRRPDDYPLNSADDGPNIEAPSIAYDASTGTCILFYSSRRFVQAPYNIRYATSSSINGPYIKQPVSFLQTGGTSANIYMPGGIDITKDGKKAYSMPMSTWVGFRVMATKRVRAMYASDLDLSNGVRLGRLY